MTVVDLYTIQIIDDLDDPPAHDEARTAALMAEAEENLTLLLPPNYRAVVRRWNQPDLTQEEQDE